MCKFEAPGRESLILYIINEENVSINIAKYVCTIVSNLLLTIAPQKNNVRKILLDTKIVCTVFIFPKGNQSPIYRSIHLTRLEIFCVASYLNRYFIKIIETKILPGSWR